MAPALRIRSPSGKGAVQPRPALYFLAQKVEKIWSRREVLSYFTACRVSSGMRFRSQSRCRFDLKDARLIHDPVLLIACGNVVEDDLILPNHVPACRMQMTEDVVLYMTLLNCLSE